MNNFIKKIFDENNLIIAIPAIIVILIIISFMIYGFSQPRSTTISEIENLLAKQTRLETTMVEEYNEGTYTKTEPFIKVNPYGIAPLSALLMFDTEETTNFKIVVKGKTTDADLEFITGETNKHTIPLYGLYEGSTTIELYEYSQVEALTGEMIYTTNVDIVIAEEDILRLPDATIDTTYEYFSDDFMMLSPATSNLPVAYDYNGDVRWYLNIGLGFGPEFLDNGHLMIGTDRIISDPYYTTGLYEMDLLGKIYKEYYIPGGFHHDLVELDNGNLLVLSSDFNGTVEDIVVEIDRTTGTVIKTWDIADYIPTTEGMTQMWTSADWFHNNSIDFDSVNNSIILSGRHQDAVISIGYDSGDLNWIIGDPTNWDTPNLVEDYFFTPTSPIFEWQYAQHSAKLLPDGNIFIFDNGNNKSKNSENYVSASSSYSRGVIYDINTDTMEIAQVYQYGKELGPDFYSPYISNVEYYTDSNYMIHSGGIAYSSDLGPLNIPAPLYNGEGTIYENSITVELLNDEIAYRLRVSGNYYRAARLTPYNSLTVFTLGAGEALGNQAVTKQYLEPIDKRYTFFDTLPIGYELNVVKQTDRLVVEGIFNRYEEIYLILESDTDKLLYNIPTSRSAYTAMCSSVFQGDERFLTFYVNEEGISGNYRVYLNIDGRQYDTYQVVEFK
ncbi:Arylsulfate sulfotransferase AssT precursor [Candidatus Izimaplasma bacterium HR1]|uniref:aryl-sulfate sulfotransferase n=1 Tax=Candidatus Izimoplasma sp. HR1 TaxID=1541959 RepID=UPI0004F6CEA9|nr:Arylsulfate sulfotransferase AssT precursor [Candidatus Izimaplasma bacterium HR1]